MNNQILRIIDANFNRAQEGVRVVEDILRFFYEDKKIYFQLRKIRHRLTKIFYPILYSKFVLVRDSKKDPGKKAKEKKYSLPKEIVISNLHRIEESLRVLEEVCKLVCIKKVLEIKKLRYTVYDLEKEIFQKIIVSKN